MVYVFLADGFEEVEALTPVDYLRRAGVEVITVGVGSLQIKGAHGITVVCDTQQDSITADASLEGIVLPGGMPGTVNLENSSVVQDFITYCADNRKMLAAICAAPSILGHRHLLEGRKAVCFPGFENDLYGADVQSSYSVTDENFITAKGAGSASEFAFDIIAYLVSEDKAQEIKNTVQTCY